MSEMRCIFACIPIRGLGLHKFFDILQLCLGLWLGFSTYSIFKMVLSATFAWGIKEVAIIIVIINMIFVVVVIFSCSVMNTI